MPAWFFPLFWKYGVPLIIAALRKAGSISAVQELEAEAVVKLESLKTYSTNDQLNPGKSDFPSEIGRDNMRD